MKYLRSAVLGFGLLLAISAANAQGSGVKANIPFEFVAGNQVLPAGEYLVTTEGASGQVVLMRSTENKVAKLAIAFNCSTARPADSTKLVFHAVGGRYYLYQIWRQGFDQGRQFPKSKIEMQLAKTGETPGEFVLAANVTR